ncbi:hypothetical protein DPMN_133543 [Dreissena polymorpha]|uniref:Ubiquitin-like domain-containing protein n=1 Tax=Dreissena polymorpha TaxID=45954 RepID=A0A9D4FVR5_DREPO|nr:hypothetical protein DPMN_133543 [Dreissena polymorpha]
MDMEDHRYLSSYNIQKDSILSLVVRLYDRIKIFVNNVAGKAINLEVEPLCLPLLMSSDDSKSRRVFPPISRG